MPVNDNIRSLYRSSLEGFISTPESGFGNLNADQYGIGVNLFSDRFKNIYSLSDDDIESLKSDDAQEILQNFKSATNSPRFIPKQEDFGTYYDPLSINPNDTIENKIATVDKWKESSLAKASALRPADSEDFKYHLEGVANSFIREEVGKDNKTGWLGDKFYRSIEGFARMGTSFADIQWADRFLAENMPENPDMDADIGSLFFSAFGELSSQALIALGTSATVGPEAIPSVLGSIYSARAMKEGYDEQFKRDGNILKAMDASIASIPGALLETVADSLLFKGGGALRKTFADEWLLATTDEAKREILKQAMPAIGKEIAKNGLSEATVGSIGADFTTGFGRYLATGDSSYIPSPEDLAKGALVEGVLGAGYSGLTSGNLRSEGAAQISQEMFQQDKQKQTAIFNALRSGNFNEAVNVANNADAPVAPTQEAITPTEENAASVNTSTDRAFTLPFESASRMRADARKFRDSGDIQEADRLDAVANNITTGSYQMPSAFSKNQEIVGDETSLSPDTGITSNDIILEDGQTLPKDKNIVFINGVTPEYIAEIAERFNGVSIKVNQNFSDRAKIAFRQNGVTKQSSEDFQFSTTPRRNWQAIEMPSATFLNDSEFISNSFSFLGKVSSYKKASSVVRQQPQQTQAPTDAQIEQDVALAVEEDGLNTALNVLSSLESGNEYVGNIDQDVEIALNAFSDYANKAEAAGDVENYVYANDLSESIVAQYLDRKEPVQRWPIPRSSGQPSINTNTEVAAPAGQDVTYLGQRGTLTTTSEGIFFNGDTLISNNPDMPISEIEGVEPYVEPSTEFTLGPDSSGRMFKFENGFKVYQDGESVKIVNRRGNRTGLNPVVQPNLPTYPVNVNTNQEAVTQLTENPSAIVTQEIEGVVTEATNFQDQAPVNPTLNDLQAEQAAIPETQDEVDNFNNSVISQEIAEQVAALESANVNTIPELLDLKNKNSEFSVLSGFKFDQNKEKIKINSAKLIWSKMANIYDRLWKATNSYDLSKDNFVNYITPGFSNGSSVMFDLWNLSEKDSVNYSKSVILYRWFKSDPFEEFRERDTFFKESIDLAVNQYSSMPESEITKESLEDFEVDFSARRYSNNAINEIAKTSSLIEGLVNDAARLNEPVFLNPSENLSYQGLVERSSNAIIYNEKDNSFRKLVEDFVSSITNEKGRAAWDGKIDEAVRFYESGGDMSINTLSKVQKNALDRLIQQYDTGLGKKIRKEQQSNDKVSKELNDSERVKMERFSTSNNNTNAPRISYNDAIGLVLTRRLPVTVVNTARVGPMGMQWKGWAKINSDRDAEIFVNVRNIRDEGDLVNTINEEIGHIVYNNPDLRSSIDTIVAKTPIDRSLLQQGYTESDLIEESVTKRVADLIDQYNEKGTFQKLLTAIKAYVKDALGFDLSDSDLQYIAYRAIDRALKNPNLMRIRANQDGTVSRFSTAANNNTNVAFEDSDILSQVRGVVSPRVKAIRKKMDALLDKKLEQKLIVEEPENYKLIKNMDFQFLNQDDLEAYDILVDDFINTRRSLRSGPKPTNVRLSQDELSAELTRLHKASEQGQFDFLQIDNEFLQGKDFANDFKSDLDLVKQAVKDVTLATDSDTGSPNLKADARDKYIVKIFDLQDIVRDNISKRVDDIFTNIIPEVTGSETVNKHLSKLASVTRDHVAKERARVTQAVNELMTDPRNLGFKETRQRYYSLMSLISDNYISNASNFISTETRNALATNVAESEILTPFNSRFGMSLFQNSASFATNIRRLGNKMSDVMFKLTTPFRTGIENSERAMNDFVRPALAEAQAAAEKVSGKKYTPYDMNLIGVYTLGKNFKTTESVAQGMLFNKQYFLDSINKLANNFDPKMAEAMAKMKDNVGLLFNGINTNMSHEQALELYERNATAMGIDAGMRQYSQDGIAIGEATRPLAKYTTESVYGRHFTEWTNYIPVFAIENPGVVHVDLSQLQTSSDDKVLGDLSDNTNMVTNGLGSTKERGRRLGQAKVLVFNFNAMVEGRTRINLLDYMTASARRELNEVISSKGDAFPQLANLLKDGGKHGDRGRISHVQKTVRTMWNNSIQSASYIGEMQGIANNITSLWAGVKLSSFYQFPAQLASNLMPYFIANATNPQKISRFFEASNMLLKYRNGTIKDERLRGTIERILYAIESRQQDTFLDKTVALDVDGEGMFNAFKNSESGRKILSGINTINKAREKVLFWQFKASDNLSGAPMMLAEYMDREVKAGRAVDWDGLTFNEESYFGAIDEIERFIGIGGNSRRGVWLNGKNGWMTLVRNMVSAFSSHRINNATNFRGEWFKLTNSNLTNEERMESARYMTGIAAQSALFTIVKAGMVGMFYNLLTDKMGDDENEEELESYYRQLISGNHRPEDKKIIQAEISLREKIRNEFKRVRDNAVNAEVIGMSMLKDTLSNAFIFPAITDVPLNMVIHTFWDKSEAEAFKQVKSATIEHYKTELEKAKRGRNIDLQIDYQKQISQWEAQEAIQFVYPNMSIIPFDGAYGGVLKDASRFMEKGAGTLMGADTMSLNDMLMGLGIAGIGLADVNRVARLVSKQEDYEKEYQDAINKIREKQLEKRR